MIIFIPGRKTLNYQLKKALKKGELSLEEVNKVHETVIKQQKISQIGFKRAAISVVVIWVVSCVLTLFGAPPEQLLELFLFAFLGLGVFLGLILLFIKWHYVGGLKREFIRAVKKGYPNFDFNKLH